MSSVAKWNITAKVVSWSNDFQDVRIVGRETENILSVIERETSGPVESQLYEDKSRGRFVMLSFSSLNDAFWFRIRHDQAVISTCVNN